MPQSISWDTLLQEDASTDEIPGGGGERSLIILGCMSHQGEGLNQDLPVSRVKCAAFLCNRVAKHSPAHLQENRIHHRKT